VAKETFLCKIESKREQVEMSSGLGRRLLQGFDMFGFFISFRPDKQKSKKHLKFVKPETYSRINHKDISIINQVNISN
jgi:hypothetical protein